MIGSACGVVLVILGLPSPSAWAQRGDALSDSAEKSSSQEARNAEAVAVSLRQRLAEATPGNPDAELNLQQEMALLSIVADAGVAATRHAETDPAGAVGAWETQLRALYRLAVDAMRHGGMLEPRMRLGQLEVAAMQPPVRAADADAELGDAPEDAPEEAAAVTGAVPPDVARRVAVLRRYWSTVVRLAEHQRGVRLRGEDPGDKAALAGAVAILDEANAGLWAVPDNANADSVPEPLFELGVAWVRTLAAAGERRRAVSVGERVRTVVRADAAPGAATRLARLDALLATLRESRVDAASSASPSPSDTRSAAPSAGTVPQRESSSRVGNEQ